MKKESYLYSRLAGETVECGTCRRRCVIPAGESGWCRTRVNEGGRLYSGFYGEVFSCSINPIEKKPVFHFYPGSRWLSLGSVGCNFRCPGCQNWGIAHWTEGAAGTTYISPKDAVSMAKGEGCLGISWTFNEPTLWFEYTFDSARLAKDRGLRTNYVTNGFMTEEALVMIAPFLDVYRVDIKGFSEDTYERIAHIGTFRGILETTRRAKELGMHVEIVTNITPGFNDDEAELRAIASWIKNTLGPGTPWHVTRFHPHHELRDLPPTPVSRLEKARFIGKEEGLWYVYLGNVPGHPGENTYCHACGELLFERYIFEIRDNRLKGNKCPKCGAVVPGTF
jgi:pyruvate formate lyase activating enzyme